MILEENRDYTIDYYSNGTSFSDIHIRFILSDNSILSDTGYPSSSDTIKFDYLYTPNIDDTRAESKHTITDVQLRKEITPHWDIYTEIANSNYNFSKTAEFNEEDFTTAQENNIYKLQKKPIEENSEMVFINGFSQTKDIDYFINYEKGEVTFINKTIPDNQKVEISYHYYKSDTPNKKNVNAYSIESIYKPNKEFNIISKYNIVDPNFIPIGNVNLNKGSQKASHEINWMMSQHESASFKYETENIENILYESMYRKNSYLTSIKFNASIFETMHNIQFDDVQSSQNYKETPHKLIKYEQNINYNFSDDKVELSNTISQKNETITPSKNNNTLITGTKISYDNNFTIDHLIKSGNLTPYFSLNLSKKNASDISTYISQSIESMGINSLITFNDTIYTTNTFDKSIYYTDYNEQNSIQDIYYNYSHISSIQPFPWINTSINLSHEESISPIPGQESKVEDRETYNINQLANDAFLEFIRTPQWIISPFKQSFSNFNYTKTKKRENNRLKNYKENRYFGSINQLKPFDGFNIPKFKFEMYKTNLIDKKRNHVSKIHIINN